MRKLPQGKNVEALARTVVAMMTPFVGNNQKHHHRQWKRVCLSQAHRTTSQNKGLLRTSSLSSSRYNCERLSALPPVQRARSSSIKDILYVMNVMGKGAYMGNYGLNTGNISFEACVASWKIRTVVGTKSRGLQR